MHFKNVIIDSIAYALPDDVWLSSTIEEYLNPLYKRLGLPRGRLEMMTGIHARRHWSHDTLPSTIAAKAGENLLQKTDLERSKIDILIHASVCRNRLEPATAAYVHKDLKLSSSTQIFDLSNACLGVLNAMLIGASMIEAGTAQNILIVSGENGRTLLDNTIAQLNGDLTLNRKTIKPFFANLTIGSGGVAILLRHSKQTSEPKPLLLGGIIRTDSSANNLCEGNTSSNGFVMQTDATSLLEAGIRLSKQAWQDFEHEMSWEASTPSRIITHQVGHQHQIKLYEALDLDLKKDFSTFNELGNTGSSALPISLCKADEQGLLKSSDNILLLGIGSGLSTAMLGILWQK